MWKLIVFIACLLIGFWGTFVYVSQNTNTQVLSSTPTPMPENVQETALQPTFALQAPRQALTGSVTQLEGVARIEKRGAQEPVPARVDDILVDGEAISTGLESLVMVAFGEGIEIALDSGSRVVFANTLPRSFLVEQAVGDVVYKTGEAITVRATGTIFQIEGEVLLSYTPDEGIMNIETREGTVILSWVNNQNESQVETIPENTTAEFVFATDEVTIED